MTKETENEAKTYGVKIKWLTVSCFEIQTPGGTIVTDPFITDAPGTDLNWEAIEACDIIALSHAHWDHILDLPRLEKKFKPLLLTGQLTALPLAKWVDCEPEHVYPMSPGLELDFGWIKIRSLFGRHCECNRTYRQMVEYFAKNPLLQANPEAMELMPYGSMEYSNYLFTLPDGTKILIWGNDPLPEQYRMTAPLKPDIAILQLSRQDPVQMADFAAALGCKVLIPHHMDLKQKEEEYLPKVNRLREEFLTRVPDARFLYSGHGKWVEL